MGEDFRKPKEFRPLAEVFFEWLEYDVLGGSPSLAALALLPSSVPAWVARRNHRKNPGDSLPPVGGLFPRLITKLGRRLTPIAARDTVRLELTFKDRVKPSALSRSADCFNACECDA